ncbi:MAG: DNA-processing protein DprA [Spirochaetales bacterium]|nr:DNA-processing protein DprA [Spirochaetales bacterium]
MNSIDLNSEEYPKALRWIKDPPPVLYYRGEWDSGIFEHCLGVVGSRKMTNYGKLICREYVRRAASYGITIVSGFMYGIDANAHQAALDGKGRTIAVMPCGIDLVHPSYQKELHEKIIAQGGLVVSEYADDTPPALWTYPRRNRIIAGLSSHLLVIEAGVKSGALITAGIALKYHKKILAIPGPLTSAVSKGTNQLIKNGAAIVTSAQDVLNEYGILSQESLSVNTKSSARLSAPEKSILTLLESGPADADSIIRTTGKGPEKINAALSTLSLNNLIDECDGKYFLNGSGGC